MKNRKRVPRCRGRRAEGGALLSELQGHSRKPINPPRLGVARIRRQSPTPRSDPSYPMALGRMICSLAYRRMNQPCLLSRLEIGHNDIPGLFGSSLLVELVLGGCTEAQMLLRARQRGR